MDARAIHIHTFTAKHSQREKANIESTQRSSTQTINNRMCTCRLLLALNSRHQHTKNPNIRSRAFKHIVLTAQLRCVFTRRNFLLYFGVGTFMPFFAIKCAIYICNLLIFISFVEPLRLSLLSSALCVLDFLMLSSYLTQAFNKAPHRK